MSDLSWVMIFGVMIAYIHYGRENEVISNIQAPNPEREVNLTRWRHDGNQPLLWTKGNGAAFVDETSSKVHELIFGN